MIFYSIKIFHILFDIAKCITLKKLLYAANFETAEEELIGDCYFSCNVAYIMSRTLCNLKWIFSSYRRQISTPKVKCLLGHIIYQLHVDLRVSSTKAETIAVKYFLRAYLEKKRGLRVWNVSGQLPQCCCCFSLIYKETIRRK